MEITKLPTADALTLQVSGRLDAYWADHLAAALDEALRGGARRVRLDLSQVAFMSSVGIRVLVRYHKQLHRIEGSLAVVNPSPAVRNVLELTGLLSLLSDVAVSARRTLATGTASVLNDCRFESFAVHENAQLRCRLIGETEAMQSAAYRGPSHRVRCEPATFGLGVGAFGESFEDCRERFGELLFAGGAAIYLPTDGSNVADYLVHAAAMIPEVETLYALHCEGRFAQLLRFDATAGDGLHSADADRRVTLGAVVDACFTLANADRVAWVMIAESAGLVGAALRRSPTAGCTSIFDHPGVREWLSFTPERAFRRGVALVTGVALRGGAAADARLQAFARTPLGDGVIGHAHAAAFTYHPLASGQLDLETAVANLCERQQLLGVLHLLHDDRPIVGAGDSEFVRGALWLAPLAEVIA